MSTAYVKGFIVGAMVFDILLSFALAWLALWLIKKSKKQPKVSKIKIIILGVVISVVLVFYHLTSGYYIKNSNKPINDGFKLSAIEKVDNQDVAVEGWKNFEIKNAGYRVSFPENSEISKTSIENVGENEMFFGLNGDILFLTQYVVGEMMSKDEKDAFTRGVIDGTTESGKMEVKKNTKLLFNGYDAVESELEGSDKNMKGMIFARDLGKNTIFYILWVTSMKGTNLEVNYDKFINSFRILE